MTENKHKHVRIKLSANTKLIHPDIGEVILKMRDLSDSGVYVYCDAPDLLPLVAEACMQTY